MNNDLRKRINKAIEEHNRYEEFKKDIKKSEQTSELLLKKIFLKLLK